MKITEITTVDLVFEWQFASSFPLPGLKIDPLLVDDQGSVLLLTPDKWDRRLLHLVRCQPFHIPNCLFSVSTETLRGVQYPPTGNYLLGYTEEAFYWASGDNKTSENSKKRLWGERAALFCGLALSHSPHSSHSSHFCVAYREKFQQSAALLWCENLVAAPLSTQTPTIRWLREFPTPLTHVAMDAEGEYVVVASEEGELSCFDKDQRLKWRRAPLAPLATLKTLGLAYTVFATTEGDVGAIGEEGEMLWMTSMPADILTLAIDPVRRNIALITPEMVTFLSHEGLPLMQHPCPESPPTSIALSPSGAYIALLQQNGTLCLFLLTYGERLARQHTFFVTEKAQKEQASGNVLKAVETLKTRLHAIPTDMIAYHALQNLYQESKLAYLARVRVAQTVGDFRHANELIAEALAFLPPDTDLLTQRLILRHLWRDTRLLDGNIALEKGDFTEAQIAFLESLEADSQQEQARQGLIQVEAQIAQSWQTQGEILFAQRRFADAVALFSQSRAFLIARDLPISPAFEAQFIQAQIESSLEEGKYHYENGENFIALFHFKKVLRLIAPDHPYYSQVQRSINYAQNNQKEDDLLSRFTLLE